jgi:hypothetical protein
LREKISPRQFYVPKHWSRDGSGQTNALFVWLISHQLAVLFSQNEPATSQQYFYLRKNQHQPSATGQTNKL